MEKIEVKYASVGGIYHKYLVYTDSTGKKSAAEAFPLTNSIFDGAYILTTPVSSEIGYSPFGTIETAVGEFNSTNFEDRFATYSSDPGEEIATTTSGDLSAEWQAIVDAMAYISNNNYLYIPTSQNSNTAVDFALSMALLQSPQHDDLTFGEHWAPGSGSEFTIQQVNLSDKIDSAISEIIESVKTAFGVAIIQSSPLVLDLDGDGVETTALSGSDAVYFDHGQDGFAEASGWVDADDGILAIDLNLDGIINNGAELFGNRTEHANGFQALKEYDSSGDGKITSADTVWTDLRVWQDTNNDGFSQDAELKTLAELLITEIGLTYSNVNTTNNGNSIKQTASFTIDSNIRTVADVYFSVDENNSTYIEDYELDARTLFLPILRGYGEIPDLHIAMSLDNSGTGNLLDMVQDFSTQSFDDLFTSTDLRNSIRDILYRWAGVEGVTSGSRGVNVDAKELSFLEKLVGENFLQRDVYSNPQPEAGVVLTKTFEEALNNFTAKLLMQASSRELFTGSLSYNPITDEMEGSFSLNLTKLDDLETEATGLTTTGEREVFWSNIVRMIKYSIGIENISSGDETALNDAIYDSDNSLDLEAIADVTEIAEIPRNQIYGTSGNDTLSGTSLKDGLTGGEGNDTLSGAGDDDIILGQNGHDTLSGDAGNDFVKGDAGNDIYVYNLGDGDDTFEDSSGTDKIVFGTGIVFSDLTIVRMGEKDAMITIEAGSTDGHIFIQDFFETNMAIETIEFQSGSPYTLSTHHWTLFGTALDEELRGSELSTNINDTMYGGAGNDEIDGLTGNDILYGEDGHDIINAGDGNNTVYGGNGNDEVSADAGTNLLHGDDGDDGYDTITGGTGSDTMYGDAGNDIIDGGSGTDTIYGGIGNDTIQGGAGKDVIEGGDGNDWIKDLDDDAIWGNAGNDTLIGGDDHNQTLYGGDDNDVLIFEESTSLARKYQYGGAGNDSLMVINAINYLDGGAGDDVYSWTHINDVFWENRPNGIYITDDSGFDRLNFNGTTAAIVLEKHGDDLLVYYDDYTVYVTDQFANPLDFAIDEIWDSYTSTLIDMYLWTPVSGNTWTGTTGGDTVTTVSGASNYSDTLNGLDGADNINSGRGSDIIDGGAGADTITAGAQSDTIIGGTGNDNLYGGEGSDTYKFQIGDGQDIIRYEELTESYDDVIEFTDGTTWQDVNFDAISSGQRLEIYYGASDKITLWEQYNSNGTAHDDAIERIVFSNATSYDLVDDINYFAFGGVEQVNQTFTGGLDIVYTYTQADTIYAGAGNDTVHSGSGNDYVEGGDDHDWLYGEDNDDTLLGNAGNDKLYGGNNNDTLDGGSGNDRIEGGTGNDTYVYSGGLDVFKEAASGTEAIQIGGSWITSDLTFRRYSTALNNAVLLIDGSNSITLEGQFQYVFEGITFSNASTLNLTTQQFETHGTSGNDSITGITTGGSENDLIYGLDGNDTINGGSGNDYIDGGVGNDGMTGGLGDDIFIVDNASDTVSESSGQGTDIIYSSISFSISSNVEYLYLTGSSNINASGNGSANNLIGNSGNNTLNGSGGADTMTGGLGDDIYVIDNASDVVTENSSEGMDTVQTSLNNYILAANVENLTLTVSNTYTMTGNSLDNYITGGTGNNTIYGGDGNDTIDGAAGNDTMYGGLGNDTYIIGSASDTANESSAEGTDTVSSSVTFTLSSNVENLTLTSSSNLNGTGNAENNILTGNSGNNNLTGNAGNDTLYGGAGTDTLSGGNDNDILYGGDGLDAVTGGSGADIFVFEAASAFNNIDTISDFNTGQSDKLNISDLLVGYTPGTSDINDFMSLTVAGSNTSVLIDRDGTSGGYSSQSIASLTGVTGLDVNTLLSNGNLIV